MHRHKATDNEKAVFVGLTRKGEEICKLHKQSNERTINQIQDKLKDYSDDGVKSIVNFFNWLERYLDEGKKQMENHKH